MLVSKMALKHWGRFFFVLELFLRAAIICFWSNAQTYRCNYSSGFMPVISTTNSKKSNSKNVNIWKPLFKRFKVISFRHGEHFVVPNSCQIKLSFSMFWWEIIHQRFLYNSPLKSQEQECVLEVNREKCVFTLCVANGKVLAGNNCQLSVCAAHWATELHSN